MALFIAFSFMDLVPSVRLNYSCNITNHIFFAKKNLEQQLSSLGGETLNMDVHAVISSLPSWKNEMRICEAVYWHIKRSLRSHFNIVKRSLARFACTSTLQTASTILKIFRAREVLDLLQIHLIENRGKRKCKCDLQCFVSHIDE